MLNKVMILGNLGADPELAYTQGGSAVCTLSIATSEKWVKDGETKEQTEWHRVKVFGKQAESCGKYLSKGSKALVEGKITYRSWEDKNTGEKKYGTDIVAERVRFIGGQQQDKPLGDAMPPPPPAPQKTAEQQMIDNIPF